MSGHGFSQTLCTWSSPRPDWREGNYNPLYTMPWSEEAGRYLTPFWQHSGSANASLQRAASRRPLCIWAGLTANSWKNYNVIIVSIIVIASVGHQATQGRWS